MLPDCGYLVSGHISDPRPPAPESTFWVGRFDASGAPLGAAVQIGSGVGPFSTSALHNGGWVSAWQAVIGPFSPQPHVRAFVKVFSTAGEQIAAVAISPDLQGDQFSPSTATLQDGNFVVAWRVHPFTGGAPLPPVQLQLFDQSGAATSPIIDVELPVSVAGLLGFSIIEAGLQLTPLASGGFLLSVASVPDSAASVVTVLGQVLKKFTPALAL